MRVLMKKKAGGLLEPESEIFQSELTKIKNDSFVWVEIKKERSYKRLKRAMALVKKAFDYWSADLTDAKFLDERLQFEFFRERITILAGYYDQVYDLRGNMRMVAKSWSFAKMSEDEFISFYGSLWQAIATNICSKDGDQQWLVDLF